MVYPQPECSTSSSLKFIGRTSIHKMRTKIAQVPSALPPFGDTLLHSALNHSDAPHKGGIIHGEDSPLKLKCTIFNPST